MDESKLCKGSPQYFGNMALKINLKVRDPRGQPPHAVEAAGDPD